MLIHDRRGIRHFRRAGDLLTEAAKLRRQRLTGIGLIIATFAVFAMLDATAKYLNNYLDPRETAWARYTSAFLLTFLVFNPIRNPKLLRTAQPGIQIIRSILLVASTVLNFIALQTLQLDEALAIIFTFPFIVAIAAGPLLGEWIGWRRWAAICVGFAGVLLITRPGVQNFNVGAIYSLASVICYGFYAVTTRIAARTDSTQTSLFYANMIGALVMLPFIPFVWKMPQSWLIAALMALTGVLGSFGHFLLIAAHRLAPASVLSPFIYTQLIWVVIIGYVVFDHLPNSWTVAGGSIVVGSGLYLLYRERKLGGSAASRAAVEDKAE
jgi:drug/metabolite transporter (DMT)-like permease